MLCKCYTVLDLVALVPSAGSTEVTKPSGYMCTRQVAYYGEMIHGASTNGNALLCVVRAAHHPRPQFMSDRSNSMHRTAMRNAPSTAACPAANALGRYNNAAVAINNTVTPRDGDDCKGRRRRVPARVGLQPHPGVRHILTIITCLALPAVLVCGQEIPVTEGAKAQMAKAA